MILTGDSVVIGENGQRPEVLIVLAQLEVGGTERHVLGLVKALVQKGWRIAVYCLAGNGPLRAEFEATGATIIIPPIDAGRERASIVARALRLVRVVGHLLTVLIRRRPSIVHVYLPAAYVLAGLLAIVVRAPIRIMSRRSLNAYRKSRPLVWWIEQRLHGRMTAILGNSLSVIRELRDEECVPESRLGLIYNGVDIARFTNREPRSVMRTKLGLAPSAFVMVIIANLIPYKGHSDLIEALGLAKLKLPADWRLLAVGDDYGISGELREQARALGIADKISLLGVRNDVADILLAADAGLLCSHEEGFSNAVLEGMAAGLPMIVTSVGGNPEAVLNEETGIIVPSRDPQRLAAAIVRLAGDAELRKRFGTAGKRRIAEKFSIDKTISSYEALYRILFAGGSPEDVPQIRFIDGVAPGR
jgi:glycosyltransferase involved in cell wall biosynthesis